MSDFNCSGEADQTIYVTGVYITEFKVCEHVKKNIQNILYIVLF